MYIFLLFWVNYKFIITIFYFEEEFMETLSNIIDVTNTFLWTYILVAALIVLGIYFTIRTKFVQFRYFKEMFRLFR